MTPLDVHVVIGAYPPSIGGAQLHTQQLVQALLRSGQVRPRVSTLWSDTRSDYLLGTTVRLGVGTTVGADGDVPVDSVRLRRRRLLDRPMAYGYLPLRRTASEYFAAALDYPPGQGDLVHAVRLGREHLAVAALRDARRHDVPFVLTPNHHPRWSGRRPDPVWRRLYRSADAVVALTEVERGLLTDLGVAPERVVVTGIGPVLSEPADLDGLALPDSYLLFLGQQLSYKRVDIALDVLALLLPSNPDLHLVLAGPQAPTTEAAVARRGLAARVRRLGLVDTATKTGLLRSAHALLFPSEQEAFGGVLVEAACTGTPFVARDLAQLVEVRDRLDWGVVAPGTATDLAAAVQALLDSPPKKPERDRAAARARETFDWSRLAEQYAALYRRLARG